MSADRDLFLERRSSLDHLGVILGADDSADEALLDRAKVVGRLAALLATPGVSPVVLGEAGVGKSSVVEQLGRSMHRRSGELPRSLRGKKLILITSSDLLSGALFANQLEHKVRLIVDNLRGGEAFLVLDDVSLFAGSGGSSSDPDGDVLNLLLPYVRRGIVQVVATATTTAWAHLARTHGAFTRALTPLVLSGPTPEELVAMLLRRNVVWRRKHRTGLTRQGIGEAIALAERLYPWKRQPGAVCDLVEFALATTSPRESALPAVGGPPTPPRDLGATGIAEAVQKLTGLPAFMVVPSQAASAKELRAFFTERLFGQPHVVEPLVNRIQLVKARMCAPGRPLAAYLLAGPTGVGKTLAARTLAALMLGDERRLVRFDMSEFAHPDAVRRFLGDGRRTSSLGLVDVCLAEPFPVVLLDEIEKAHRAVLDVLLQALGEGRLTDETGRTAHLTNAIVLMTSNLGFDRRRIDQPRRPPVPEAFDAMVRAGVRRHLRPELLNRLTDVLVFRPLSLEAAISVAHREVARLAERRGLKGRDIGLSVSVDAITAIVEAGYSPELGARPMERAVDRLLGSAVAALLAECPQLEGIDARVDVGPSGALYAVAAFRPTAERPNRIASPHRA